MSNPTDIKTLRDILKIGQAVIDCGRCEELASDELYLLEHELIRSWESALVFIRALRAVERHQADPRVQDRWILVAEAVARLVRLDIEKLNQGLAAAEGDQ